MIARFHSLSRCELLHFYDIDSRQPYPGVRSLSLGDPQTHLPQVHGQASAINIVQPALLSAVVHSAASGSLGSA